MLKKILSVLICVILCVSMTACNPRKAINDISANEQGEEAETQKYNAYIDLNNYMTGEFDKVMNHYFDKLGTEQEPIIEKHFSFSPRTITKSGRQKLETAFKFSSQKPAYADVDASLQELYPKMNELMDLLEEARSYYDLKTYVDDDFVKAKELHNKIVASYDSYHPLFAKFYDSFSGVVAEHRKQEMESYKKSDRLLSYHFMSVLLRTEDLQTEMENQNITSANITDLDLVKFKEKYNLLVEDVNKIMEYAKDEKRVKREGFNANSSYYSSFIGDVGEIKVAATEIIERVQKKQSINKSDLQHEFLLENRDGTPEKLQKKYDNAIRDYNNMVTK